MDAGRKSRTLAHSGDPPPLRLHPLQSQPRVQIRLGNRKNFGDWEISGWEPIALQLRFLQTMREISSEHNTTTFLPVPIDLFTPFLKKDR